MIRYKILGRNTGLRVSEVALGTGMFGRVWGYGAEPAEVRAILQGFAEAGGNFIDTADNYQWGDAERQVGELVAGRRDDFVIASKFSRGAAAKPALAGLGNSRKAMVQAVEASLRRLGTDRIDLYFAHMDDGMTPMEELARGLDDLVRAGKIVYGGLSNFPAWRIALASNTADLRGWTPISAVQLEYNLLERTCERELLPMADGLGLGVMAWSPMAGGLLTGKYRRGETGRATELEASVLHAGAGNTEAVLDALAAVAAELDTSMGRVAIAWVQAKGALPVLGPRTRAQLDDNLAALALRLDPAQLARLDAASAAPRGYPHDLNAAPEQRATMTGGLWERLDPPARTVA